MSQPRTEAGRMAVGPESDFHTQTCNLTRQLSELDAYPEQVCTCGLSDVILAIEQEAAAAREAEIRAVAEGPHFAPHEVGLDEMHCGACDQWWPCDAARLLAAIGSPAPLPHFEPGHFRAIWFENVRVFENEEGTGWRCLDDETGEVADGATPEAAIAAMFGAKAAIGQTAAPRLDRHTSECIEWMYRITAEATGDRACICGAVLGSPAAPRLDRERLARALWGTDSTWLPPTEVECNAMAGAIADAYEADQP